MIEAIAGDREPATGMDAGRGARDDHGRLRVRPDGQALDWPVHGGGELAWLSRGPAVRGYSRPPLEAAGAEPDAKPRRETGRFGLPQNPTTGAFQTIVAVVAVVRALGCRVGRPARALQDGEPRR